ncbi:MAG: DUF4221 family protein [Bacteroidales bacterium]
MTRIMVLLGVLLFIFNCNKTPTQCLKYEREITLTRATEEAEYFYTQYIDKENGEDLILGNPQNSKTLYYHNLNDGSIVKKVVLPCRQAIRGFYCDRNDDIYYCPNHSPELLKYSHQTFQIDTLLNMDIPYLENCIKHNIKLGVGIEFMVAPCSPLIINKPYYYIPNIIHPDYNILEQPPLYIFEEVADSLLIHTEIVHFPDKLHQNGKSLFPYNLGITYTINDKNELIVSHFADHHIYVYNNDKLDTIVLCKSKYVDKLPSFINKNEIHNEQVYVQRSYSENSYVGIYYDKYRNLYYRIAKLKSKFADSHSDQSDFVVIIIDENFKMIGEQIFNHTDYLSVGLIITKEGLLLKKTDNYSGKTRYGLFKINTDE